MGHYDKVAVDHWVLTYIVEPKLIIVGNLKSVVIAHDQVLVSIKPRHQSLDVVVIATQSKVAKYPYAVALTDGVVPIGDKGVVHFLDITKRAVAVFDDFMMTEVWVSNEEVSHSGGLLYLNLYMFPK